MSFDFASKWNEISSRGRSAGRFRVLPDHLLDLFISFSIAGEREFTLGFSSVSFDADCIPVFENMCVKYTKDEKGQCSLTLQLTDSSLTDLFSVICIDLAGASSIAETAEGAVQIFVMRLTRWAELLRGRRSSELSFNERLGLLGELSILVWIIDKCGVDASLAVRGWRGPNGDTNDIGVNNIRVEVKSQLSTRRKTLKISSLDQLDRDGRNLFVALNRFCSSEYGISLGSLVSNISSRFLINSNGFIDFYQKLVAVGYDHSAEYVNEVFQLEGVIIYRVDDAFPKLVPQNVSVGITRARYEVACEAIAEFIVESSELEVLINA
jgi:hypothetical protein